MRDVARTAGVSLKTVSRVINGEAAVAPATAARVTGAITELGFERNDLARSLRHGLSSGTLGLVIEDVGNPFYSVVAGAVEDAARERGLLLITASAREDPARELEVVSALLRRRVDALLMVPTGPDHRYVQRSADHVSAVFLDRPPREIDADTVLADNAGGARRGTEHLLARGHTRIAFLADDGGLYTAQERLAGYRAALAAAGVTAQPELVRTGNHDAAAAQAAVDELLALPATQRPTAILAANNRNTVGAVRALARRRQPDRARRLRRLRARRRARDHGHALRPRADGPQRRRARVRAPRRRRPPLPADDDPDRADRARQRRAHPVSVSCRPAPRGCTRAATSRSGASSSASAAPVRGLRGVGRDRRRDAVGALDAAGLGRRAGHVVLALPAQDVDAALVVDRVQDVVLARPLRRRRRAAERQEVALLLDLAVGA